MTSMDWIGLSALGVVIVMLIYGDELFRIVSAVIVCLILGAILTDQARGATSEPAASLAEQSRRQPGLYGIACTPDAGCRNLYIQTPGMSAVQCMMSAPFIVDRLRREMRPGELLMGWQCR